MKDIISNKELIFQTDCFAFKGTYKDIKTVLCQALKKERVVDCENCKFYKSKPGGIKKQSQ